MSGRWMQGGSVSITGGFMPKRKGPWLISLGLLLMAGPAIAGASECALSNLSGEGDLHSFLGRRAVEVIKLAAKGDQKLSALIDPSASFDLGSGDVGRPLGIGVDGARALAHEMNADTYRFVGWDAMSMPVDPCSRQKVEVEFIYSPGKQVSIVEFTFEAGRVVSAKGWMRSFETGGL